MSHMRVSNSVEKAFQLAFLKLKRRRKGVGVGVTAALIRMAIGRCWVCGIGSSTALLLSDAMKDYVRAMLLDFYILKHYSC